MTEPAPALNPTHVRYLYGALKAMMAVLSELPTTDYMDGRRDQCKHMLDMLDELTDEARTDAKIEAQALAAIWGTDHPGHPENVALRGRSNRR